MPSDDYAKLGPKLKQLVRKEFDKYNVTIRLRPELKLTSTWAVQIGTRYKIVSSNSDVHVELHERKVSKRGVETDIQIGHTHTVFEAVRMIMYMYGVIKRDRPNSVYTHHDSLFNLNATFLKNLIVDKMISPSHLHTLNGRILRKQETIYADRRMKLCVLVTRIHAERKEARLGHK